MDSLLFVYNADSGFFSGLFDTAHKWFSPSTYACNLCRLTHGAFGMRQAWRRFVDELGRLVTFLHRDEFRRRHGLGDLADLPLPAIFGLTGDRLILLLDAPAINSCDSLKALQQLLTARLSGTANG